MTPPTPAPIRARRLTFVRFLVSVLLPFGAALALFYLLLRPSLDDLSVMLLLMTLTTLVSVVAAYGAYRLGWIHRSPYLRWTLMAGYALAGLLVFLNVAVIAKLMFASRHDLLLAMVLLVFASGIAMASGYLLSAALTERIGMLMEASQELARGNLSVRVPVTGRDEMATLAQMFNQMASQLEETRRKQSELDQLRRDLIAWVGHDLRTPLTSIRAILEALADGLVEDPQTVQRYLLTAQKDIRSLSGLIDDLFDLAQMDAGGLHLDVHPGAIDDLISDTIESFSELAARQDITLEGSSDANTGLVPMDTPRIGRVLANLVSNSLYHTPPGGRVAITARRAAYDVQVCVCDSGDGIPPEDLPHVFERFYRGDKSRSRQTGGTGLGLAIAHGIITAHGGRIWVESTPGQGAQFSFVLPVE
ncbi:MAG: HAMP domain-containing sensor histidine kinase [Anaerolineaceae bacterium]|nr:HAMP domain-containing sensor histidine kinase [Anaerolineaceae bacterium]